MSEATPRVALFVTCVADTLFPAVGVATCQVLERLGCRVSFPLEQTCCGQIHVNAGYEDLALPLVRRFLAAFADCDAIVTPSGSCAALVRHQYPRLAAASGDPELIEAAETTAAKVFELSQYIVDVLGVDDVGASYPHRVTYHPTCHSLRMLGVVDPPRRLLEHVRGLELVELPEATVCCGFGGTFAIKNADTSAAMLSDKVRAVKETRAEACTALDSSCLMHIGGGLSRNRTGVRAVHLAEILAAREGG